MDADVVIAGGGLAGASTAAALRARGLSVLVVDRAEFPRDKPCGEGLLPHGVERLRALGFGEALAGCAPQAFRGIAYRCGEVLALGDFAGGACGMGVRRHALDEALRNHAAALGARFVHGTVVDVAHEEGGPSAILASGIRLRARHLVGADGPRSVVRHALGLDGGAPRRPRYARRRHFALPAHTQMPERVEVCVGDGHELYLTPVEPGVIGVAALCEKRVLASSTGSAEARLDELISRCPPVSNVLAGSTAAGRVLSCGPLRVRARDVVRARVFLVGDAAGYVDAITGEGMSLALAGAEACAQAIAHLHEGASPELVYDAFRVERARAFRDHALLTSGLVELARHPRLAKRAIARLAREPALFTRLLQVNDGRRTLLSLGALDFLRLAWGARPQQIRPSVEPKLEPKM